MTDLVLGVALVVLVGAGATVAARALSVRLVPELDGAAAILACAVLAVALVTVSAELIGALGAFNRLGLMIDGALLLVIGHHFRRHRPRRRPRLPPAAAPVLALLAGEWTSRVVTSAGRGIYDVDSLRYHLPLAAGFVQTGWTTRLHFTELDLLSAFDPLNAEVIHGIGMSAFRADTVSPLINVAWLGLALLAGWCVGSAGGRSGRMLGLLVAALLCGTPLSAVTMPGAATDDVVVIALLMASLALTVQRSTVGSVTVAGVAAGLAVGTKFTAVAPALALAVLVLGAARHGQRWAYLRVWVAGADSAGAFWYVRNVIRVGNPVPSVNGLGLPSPDDRVLRLRGLSIAHYLSRPSVLRRVVPDGLHHAFGPAWPVVVVVAVAGVVVPLAWPRAGDAVFQRGLALAALVCAVAYVFTPYSAGGPDGDPWQFAVDVRFAYPAVAFAMFALCRWVAPSKRLRTALEILLFVLLVVEQFGAFAAGQPAWGSGHRVLALTVAIAVGMAGAASADLRARRYLAGAAVLALVGMIGALSRADGDWYRGGPYATPVYRWAATTRHSTIAVVGFPLQYPLFGRHLSNDVQYAGRNGPHGAFGPILRCPEFLAALARARATYAVIGPDRLEPRGTPEVAWLEAMGARRVLTDGSTSVLTLPSELTPSRCVGAP